MTAINLSRLREWIGNTQVRDDVITQAPAAALSATLNHEHSRALAGQALPPCWHWLYFLELIRTAEVAVDGHPQRGNFLPPVPLPRRMWAGSRLRFLASLPVGAPARRVSTIQSVGHKQGRSGDLVFVTVVHQVFCRGELCVEEEQDLVYRENAPNNTPLKPASVADTPTLTPPSEVIPTRAATAGWSREIQPDPVLLFRYSALTFNSHRVHYDRDYAVSDEGYDGLVVQGPLTATLLLDLLYREQPLAQIATFDFRAIRPLYEGSVMRLHGAGDGQAVTLRAINAEGDIAMEARASLARYNS
jgi:3-methylfumaryl-CoA hydratase